MKRIVAALPAGLLLAGCANNDWVNSHIADGPQEARQLTIDEGYCTAVVEGAMPAPNPRVYSSSPTTYSITGSTMSTGTGGARFGTFNGTVTTMPTPSQNMSNTIANAGALATVIGSNIRRARVYDACMMSLGWDDASEVAEAAVVEPAAAVSSAAPAAPRPAVASPAVSSPSVTASPSVPVAGCAGALLRSGTTLAQGVAALGRSIGCMPMAPGGSTGTTLIGEGAAPGGGGTTRLMVIVSRSDEAMGSFSDISAGGDAFVGQMTGGSSAGGVEPVRVPTSTTIAGHQIQLVGFSMQRETDPARYACVGASDRTTEATIAVVCRAGATKAYSAVAERIISEDLPGIQW